MSLRIYNTLRRALEVFQPLQPGHVRMYVCGMTVYDLCHLGHARSMVAFDVVQRWLRVSGYEVTYVRNITDIDDKIIQRAVKNNETVRSLTDRMIAALHQDADALGLAVLGPGRGHPDHGAGDGQLGRVLHQGEEHENFVPQSVATVGGDEDAAIFHVRHESGVKR